MEEVYILRRGQPMTAEQEARLDALAKMPDDEIVFDEDCPELTDEQIERLLKRTERIRKTA